MFIVFSLYTTLFQPVAKHTISMNVVQRYENFLNLRLYYGDKKRVAIKTTLNDMKKKGMQLPELSTEFRSEVHGATGLDAESFEELGDMRQSGVHTVLGQTVNIGSRKLQFSLLADIAGPYTGIGQEENHPFPCR